MLLKPGPLTGEMSGSVGGLTFARNRGGQYCRQRSNPTNPNTYEQQLARTSLTIVVEAWGDQLTDAQRTGWETYAANITWLNRLGEEINITGQQCYVRTNSARLRAGLARIDDAPTTFSIGDWNFAEVLATVDNVADTITLNYDDTEDWCDEDGSAMIIQVGNVVAGTINYYNSPFVVAGTIDGNSVTPPTSPDTTIVVVGPLVAGQQVPLRMRIAFADGRLSAPQVYMAQVV